MARYERILVLGAKGQLGSALVGQDWPIGTTVLPATRDQLDITDPDAVRRYMAEWRPEVVINAAGYTAIDRAEDEPEVAIRVNSTAVESLVEAVGSIGARLIQISTADVFDGATDGWYTEHDQVNPLGVYGRSMRWGELAALESGDSLVVRTSWLYSTAGTNFVKTIHALGERQNSLDAVDDLHGCPTSANELARALVVAIEAGLPYTGVFHVAAPDAATWWELADETLRAGGRRDRVQLGRLQAADCSPVARRPVDARLSSEAFSVAYGVTLSPWRDALRAVTNKL